MKYRLIHILSKIPYIKNRFSGIGTIFMLHRVADFNEKKLFPNENMKISPEFLESFILKLKEQGYEFISLDELNNIVQQQKRVKKKIVFTLDDGYKDNYEIAYPIFKKYNVPFTIYVTTSFPNKKAILWWYEIEDLIIKNEKLKVENEIYLCQNKQQKEQAFYKLRKKILKLDQRDLLNELNNLFYKYNIDWFSKNDELCMNWDDIKILSKEKLCSISGHTRNHYAFNKLDEDEIINEVLEANTEIEKYTGQQIDHFAYPFGSINEVEKKEIEIVKNLNFKTVTTTRNGNIYLKHKKFMNCCLPRVMLTENLNIKNISKIQRRRVVTV